MDANAGICGYELDVTDLASIEPFVSKLVQRHPHLNAIIHNAGIMTLERVLDTPYDLNVADRTIATNLVAQIHLTAALLPHLTSKHEAAVVTVSSGLAFVPRSDATTYSATKAAIHSWSQSLRHQLRSTKIKVIEIAPPLVATDLTPGQSSNPHAMPLGEFVSEAIKLLCDTPTPEEVLVQRVLRQRTAEAAGNYDEIFRLINPV